MYNSNFIINRLPLAVVLAMGIALPTTAQEENDQVLQERAIVVSATDDLDGNSSIMTFEMSDADGPMILADSFAGSFGGAFDLSMGHSGDSFSMLNNASVQKDLQLVDEQLDQIKQINQDFGQKIKEQMEMLRDEDGKFNLQMGSDLGELIRNLKQQQQEQISGILLPNQQKRLEQVARQMRMQQQGTAKALTGKLSEQLGLSADQKKSIRAKSKELKKRLEEQIAELRAKAKRELLDELTSDQKAKLTDLLGDDFVQKKEDQKNRFQQLLRRRSDSKSGDF